MPYNYININNQINISKINRKAFSYVDLKTKDYIIIPDPNNPEFYNWIHTSSKYLSEAGANVFSNLSLNNTYEFLNYINIIPSSQSEVKIFKVYDKLDISQYIEGAIPGEPYVPPPTETIVEPVERKFEIGNSISSLSVAALRIFFEYFRNSYDLGSSEQYDELFENAYSLLRDEDILQAMDLQSILGWFKFLSTLKTENWIKSLSNVQTLKISKNKSISNFLSILHKKLEIPYFGFLYSQNLLKSKEVSNFLIGNNNNGWHIVQQYISDNSYEQDLFLMNYLTTSTRSKDNLVFNYLATYNFTKDTQLINFISSNRVELNNSIVRAIVSNQKEYFVKIIRNLQTVSSIIPTSAYTSIHSVLNKFIYPRENNITTYTSDSDKEIHNFLNTLILQENLKTDETLVNKYSVYPFSNIRNSIIPISTTLEKKSPKIIIPLINSLKRGTFSYKYNWIKIYVPTFLKTDKVYNWIKIENPIEKYYYNFINIETLRFCMQPRSGIRYLVAPFIPCSRIESEKLLLKVKLRTGEILTFDVRFQKLNQLIDINAPSEALKDLENKINHKIILKSNKKGFIPQFPPIYLKVIDTTKGVD